MKQPFNEAAVQRRNSRYYYCYYHTVRETEAHAARRQNEAEPNGFDVETITCALRRRTKKAALAQGGGGGGSRKHMAETDEADRGAGVLRLSLSLSRSLSSLA